MRFRAAVQQCYFMDNERSQQVAACCSCHTPACGLPSSSSSELPAAAVMAGCAVGALDRPPAGKAVISAKSCCTAMCCHNSACRHAEKQRLTCPQEPAVCQCLDSPCMTAGQSPAGSDRSLEALTSWVELPDLAGGLGLMVRKLPVTDEPATESASASDS